jgi:hypothetical protein
MNITKNMEAIFLAAAFLTCVTSVASAAGESARLRHEADVSVQQPQQMLVVHVTAKRLTAEEKARL